MRVFPSSVVTWNLTFFPCQELDRKLIAAEIGPDEREILFKERIWLNACLEL